MFLVFSVLSVSSVVQGFSFGFGFSHIMFLVFSFSIQMLKIKL